MEIMIVNHKFGRTQIPIKKSDILDLANMLETSEIVYNFYLKNLKPYWYQQTAFCSCSHFRKWKRKKDYQI